MATKTKKKTGWKRVVKGGHIYEVWVGPLPSGGKAPKHYGKGITLPSKSELRRGALRGATEARELALFMENDHQIYRQLQSIDLNQARKACKGTWDQVNSAKLFQYAVDEAARKYGKQFGAGRSLKTAPFSIADRRAVAAEYAANFKTEYNRCLKGSCDFDAATTAVIKKCPLPVGLAGTKKRRRK